LGIDNLKKEKESKKYLKTNKQKERNHDILFFFGFMMIFYHIKKIINSFIFESVAVQLLVLERNFRME